MSQKAFYNVRNHKARKNYPRIRSIEPEPISDKELEKLMADARIEQSLVEPLKRFRERPLGKTSRAQIKILLRNLIYERDGFQCVRCGSQKALTLHHIRPVSRNGPSTYDNLQTLCRSCHNLHHQREAKRDE